MAGYLATLCPFYAARHHFWIVAFLPALLLFKEDFSNPEPASSALENGSSSVLLRLLALLGALLPVVYVFFTWFNDFPWRGDYTFHLSQSRGISRTDWVVVVFALEGLLAFSFFFFHRHKPWVGWTLAIIIGVSTILCGFLRPLPFDFARYPATHYVLQSPLFWFCKVAGLSESININRLFESLALLTWLFLLRPFVLGKRLSWPVVVTLFVLVSQADTLYYLGGAYLEPWSLVFCLVALEALVSDGDFRLSFAAIGTAAIFKEQAILLLPFFVLGAWARESFRPHRAFNLGLWSVFSVLPFFSYFLYRRDANVWRTAAPASWSSVVNPDRIHEWLFRVTTQFSKIGATILLLLIAAILVVVWWRKKRLLPVELFLISGALFLPLFFYCDRISEGWTGYPRFHLASFVIIIFLAVHLAFKSKSIVLGAFLAVFVLAQAPRFGHVWSFRDDMEANFFEHYEAPLFLPIRALLATAENSPRSQSGGAIQIVELTGFRDVNPFELGYPDLAAKYKVLVQSKLPQESTFEDPGIRPLWVLVPFIRTANLTSTGHLAHIPAQLEAQSLAAKRVEQGILAAGGVWKEVDDNNRLLGFVGIIDR